MATTRGRTQKGTPNRWKEKIVCEREREIMVIAFD